MTRGGAARRKVSPREIYGGKVDASLLSFSRSLSLFLSLLPSRGLTILVLYDERTYILEELETICSSQVVLVELDPFAESST